MKFLSVIFVFFALLSISKASGTNWTEWKSEGDKLAYRTCDVPGDSVTSTKHMIEFKNTQGYEVNVTGILCNSAPDSEAEKCDLGPDQVETEYFYWIDDNPIGMWNWQSNE